MKSIPTWMIITVIAVVGLLIQVAVNSSSPEETTPLVATEAVPDAASFSKEEIAQEHQALISKAKRIQSYQEKVDRSETLKRKNLEWQQRALTGEAPPSRSQIDYASGIEMEYAMIAERKAEIENTPQGINNFDKAKALAELKVMAELDLLNE